MGNLELHSLDQPRPSAGRRGVRDRARRVTRPGLDEAGAEQQCAKENSSPCAAAYQPESQPLSPLSPDQPQAAPV